MTTARTHEFNVGRGGAARPWVAEPTPDNYTPPSAETFEGVSFGEVERVEEVGEVGQVFDPSTLDFDPGDYIVEDVKAHIEEHPEQADAVLEVKRVEEVEEVGQAAPEFDPSTLDFDPGDYNVEDVKAHIEEHPEQADAILELELNGKERSGVLSFIENFDPESE